MIENVGLLKYTSDEIDNDKYVVSANGLHRYSVLKVRYLNSLCETKSTGMI